MLFNSSCVSSRVSDASAIKAYTIGVEALGRSPDFDADKDSIVRVEAVRLRNALDKYYQSNKNKNEVRIGLPVGAYIPTFERLSATDSLSWRMPMHWVSCQLRRTWKGSQVGWIILATIAIIAVLELLIDVDYPLHSTFNWVLRNFIG